jgi:hypothetical protein
MIEQKINHVQIFKESFIDVTKEIQKPPIALSIGEINLGQTRYDRAFGTFGNFSCITGASKSKKTFLKSALVSGFIGGQSTNYFNDFKTHRKKDMYILDFDTEQGEWHAQRTFKRVSKMVGSNYEFYKPFYLRQYDYKTRLEFIEWCILESDYRDRIGLIVVDGFADLVKDVNDLEDSNKLVQKLLMWTDKSKAHLTGILHKNYGGEKPTGHLGSAILKKSETVCTLDPSEYTLGHVRVRFTHTRGFPIDDFEFYINEQGLPVKSDIII